MRLAIVFAAVCLCVTAGGRSRHKKSSSSGPHTASSHRTRHSSRSKTRSSRLRYQLTPTPERYSEIQQALAKKGYYKGPVNGVWGSDSVEAMRRFEADQKLDGDGKLTARSLSALGLGSKHAAVAQVRPAAAPSQIPPQSSSPAASPKPQAADPPQITPSGSTPNDHRSPEGSQRP